MESTPVTNIHVKWRKRYEQMRKKYKQDYKAMKHWNDLWEKEIEDVKRELAD